MRTEKPSSISVEIVAQRTRAESGATSRNVIVRITVPVAVVVIIISTVVSMLQ